jgi:tryptophan-rich sensory protein
MRRDVVGLAVWIALCFAAAGLGSIATALGLDGWYRDLAKPAWTPPGWLFAPVWTVLYLLMAVAAWRVWLRVGLRSAAVGLFLAQLALNVGWSWLFFGLRQPGWAVAEITLLWLGILATVLAFWRTDRLAAAMLWPYLAWVSFASILNVAIWRMNR